MSRYRKQFIVTAGFFISAGFFSGCVAVKEEIFLQNVEVDGALSEPPLHITEADMTSKTLHISPYLSTGAGQSLSSTLERQYKGPIPDTLIGFQSPGLRWDLPSVKLGFDLDLAVSDNLALFGGITADVGSGRQFTSGYGGVGLFSPDSSTGFRLDIGVQYLAVSYRAATVLERTTSSSGSSSKETIYFIGRGSDSHLDLFANLTLNSANPNSSINWFFQVGISPQTLTKFTPSETVTEYPYGGTRVVSDQRAESNVFWISATPGVYFKIARARRLVLGVRLMREVLSESSSPGIMVIPILQLDWKL